MSDRELCSECGGNGVIKIHHGVSVCPLCEGDCWDPMTPPARDPAPSGKALDIARCSTLTDKQLAELLPTLTVEQRIEVVIAKYVGGAVSREYDGETTALKADARIAAYLMRKLRPWIAGAYRLRPMEWTEEDRRDARILMRIDGPSERRADNLRAACDA